MVTRNGVFYDLSKSTYRCTVDKITFVFSSHTHLIKFKTKIQENRDIINYSLTKRFNIPVELSRLADIVLYNKIETRGFLILSGGKEICQENLKFGGGMPTSKN